MTTIHNGREWLIAANDDRRSWAGLPIRQHQDRCDHDPADDCDRRVADGEGDERHHAVDHAGEFDCGAHLLPLRHAIPLQPVRLSRDEVERVDVLMRLLDERTAKQG